MRYTRRQEATFDTDGLQADVMRFLAIIAFCLIAVMSLVQHIPAPTQATTVVTETSLDQSAKLLETAHVESPARNTESPSSIRREPAPPVVPEGRESDAPEPASPSDVQTRPLSLRFASDRAFLSLIETGKITLHAKTGDGFVTMTPDFHVTAGSVSGKLFEVFGASLPSSVRKLLPGADLFLVRLPESTSVQLDQLQVRHAESGGDLVIQPSGALIYKET